MNGKERAPDTDTEQVKPWETIRSLKKVKKQVPPGLIRGVDSAAIGGRIDEMTARYNINSKRAKEDNAVETIHSSRRGNE